jgi:hypothetical protein
MRAGSQSCRTKFKRWLTGGYYLKNSGELTGAAVRAVRDAENAQTNRPMVPGIYATPDDFCAWLFAKLLGSKKTASVDETILILSIFFLLTYLMIKRTPNAFASRELNAGGFVEANLKAVMLIVNEDGFLTMTDLTAVAFAHEVEAELMNVDVLLKAAENEKVKPAPEATQRDDKTVATERAASEAQSAFDVMLSKESDASTAQTDNVAANARILAARAAARRTKESAVTPETKVRYSANVVITQIRHVLNRIANSLMMNTVFKTRLDLAGYHTWLALTGNAPANAMSDETYKSCLRDFLKVGNFVEALLITYGGTKISKLESVNLPELLMNLEKVRAVLTRAHASVTRVPASEIAGAVGVRSVVTDATGLPSAFWMYKLTGSPSAPLVFIPSQTGQTAFFTAMPSEWSRAVSDQAAVWSALFNPDAASSVLLSARVGRFGYTSTLTDLRLREEHILALCKLPIRIVRSAGGTYDYSFEVARNPKADSAVADARAAIVLRAEEAAYGISAREYIEKKKEGVTIERTLFISDTRRALALSSDTWAANSVWPQHGTLRGEHVDGSTWIALSQSVSRYLHTDASWTETVKTNRGARSGRYGVSLNLMYSEKIEARHTMVTTDDEYARQRKLAVWLYREAYQHLLAVDADVADTRLHLAPPLRKILATSMNYHYAKSIVINLVGATRVIAATSGRGVVKRVNINADFQLARVFGLTDVQDLSFISLLDADIFRHLAETENA